MLRAERYRPWTRQFQNIKIDGRDFEHVCHAKLLGVTISQRLTFNKQTRAKYCEKADKRLYMLYQLTRTGITQKDLVTVRVNVVRPVLKYACPVWRTNLPQYLSDNVEIIQKRALQCIFPGLKSAHRLNHLLPDKRHTKYDFRQ